MNQLSLLDEAGQARNQPASFQAITDLIAADPSHARERRAVITAICQDAATHNGHVDPNRVRRLIPSWVGPRVTSAVYGVLARSGVLARGPWTTNTDDKGRNNGKPLRTYYLAARDEQ